MERKIIQNTLVYLDYDVYEENVRHGFRIFAKELEKNHRTMNNEEKVNELLGLTSGEWLKLNEAGIYDNPNNTKGCLDAVYRSKLLKMAEWKDEQFSKFLLWLDDYYVIRKFDDGEPMTYGELIDAFKNMDK